MSTALQLPKAIEDALRSAQPVDVAPRLSAVFGRAWF